jgi:hypothetical protein
LAVLRIGDGSGALSGTSAPTFIDEYTIAGTLVRSINISNLTTFSNSGSATSEGQLSLSTDGRYLVFAGYNALPGTSAIAGTTASAAQRMVGLVDGNGNLTTTLLGTSFASGGNPRSAFSTNGTDIWVSSSNTGVGYTSFGSGTATQLSTSPTNTRVVNVFGGQLYVSSASGTFQGVATISTGTPTTSGQTTTLLPGFPTASGPSNYGFAFLNPTALYVADDRTTAGGGIEKWTFDGTNWNLQYSGLAGTAGLRSLTLAGNGTLYGITTANTLVSAIDTGSAFTFSTLATAGTNTVFRGVAFAPVPEPASILGVCGAGFAAVTWLRRRRAGRTAALSA